MAGVNSDLVAFGIVRDGRLRMHDRRGFDEAVRRFRDGSEVQVEVTTRRASRSQQQNRFYWGVIVQLIAEHTGYTPDELHDLLKAKFLPKRLAMCNGNGEIVDEFVIGGSTRKLTTQEFGDYCDTIRRWAMETLDVDIPDPEVAGHGWGV